MSQLGSESLPGLRHVYPAIPTNTGCPCGVEDFVEGTLTDVAARNIDTGTVQAVVGVLTLIDIYNKQNKSRHNLQLYILIQDYLNIILILILFLMK